MSKMDAQRSEFLEDLTLHITKELTEAGIDPAKAKQQALVSADAFAKRWQGLHLYVPKNIKKASQDIRKKVTSEFTGNNHGQLAIRHNVHIRTIYKILKKQEKDNVSKSTN
ncbi:Mor transcription activator family protein [Marinomonas sp. S3726]|uniref:Mor transcription activator family protein n=1 Tax=Marinomonas sp. S3726 TaxID=579484 RepID=UPI0006976B59|nr:Mor transcription activator family protein [Marinomonas sp. S3726]